MKHNFPFSLKGFIHFYNKDDFSIKNKTKNQTNSSQLFFMLDSIKFTLTFKTFPNASVFVWKLIQIDLFRKAVMQVKTCLKDKESKNGILSIWGMFKVGPWKQMRVGIWHP